MRAQLILLPFLFSLILSTAVTYLTILLYRGLGLVDRSSAKDHPKNIHTEPVPRGGGLPIYAALFFVVAMFLPVDKHVAGMMAGGALILVMGVLDDVFDLSPYLRLIMGVIAGYLVVRSGIGIKFVSNPVGEGILNLSQWQYLAEGISILWIVWAMNFVNMGAKGLDGQLPGVVVVAAAVMGILSFRFSNDITAWPSAYLSFALSGAYAGLLLFNKYPQKIMPGWGGGALAGYYLAVLSMLSGAKLATALIVLGVPLMDVIYAIVRRIMAGQSPVWGDDKHLHHRLLKIGWSKSKIAWFYWLVTGLLGVIALNLNSQMKIYTIVLLAAIVGGGMLWINYFLLSKRQESHNG